MSSRRRIVLVSRRQRDRLIRQEYDNMINAIDSADSSDSANVTGRVEPLQHMIQEVPIEPIAVHINETDSDLDLRNNQWGKLHNKRLNMQYAFTYIYILSIL